VQAVAVSSFKGGDLEFFRYMLDLCARGRRPHPRIRGGGW
jgi:hypothetical protein